MERLRYFPLVSIDREGKDLQAMTPTYDDLAIKAHFRLWLTEIVPDTYRLEVTEMPPASVVDAYRIRCPKCGATLKIINRAPFDIPLPLYACDRCRSGGSR